MMQRSFIFLFLMAMGSPALAAETSAVGSTGAIFQILLVLILVLGLMIGAAWLMKKFNAAGMTPGSNIKIVGGVSVGNRERVMVIEVADQWIVVGVTSTNVNALTTMPKRDMPQQTNTPTLPVNFASKLKQLIEKRNGQ